MATPPDTSNSRPVPTWVSVTTFLICWGLGGYLLVAESQGGTASDWLRLTAVVLVFFPLLSFHGLIPVLVRGITVVVNALAERLGGKP